MARARILLAAVAWSVIGPAAIAAESRNVLVLTGVNDKDYQVPFTFNGKIDKLTVKLGPPQMLPAEQKKAAEAAAKARD